MEEGEGVVLVIRQGGEDGAEAGGAGGDVVDWREMGGEEWEALVADVAEEDVVVSVRVDKERLLQHSHYFRSLENFGGFNHRERLHVEWSPAIFCLLLGCIHGFQPPFSSDMIAPLMQAAVYFGVDEMVTRCRDWVKSEMCTVRCGAEEDGFVSDLLSIWSMAADNGEGAIQELCVKSLAINFAEAMGSESFVTLPFALLEGSVDHPELTIKSEMDLCNALILWCENQGGEGLHEEYTNSLFQKIQLDLLPLDFILGRLLRKHALRVENTLSERFGLRVPSSLINMLGGFPVELVKNYSNFKPVIRLTHHSKELDLSFCQPITCDHLVAAAAKVAPTSRRERLLITNYGIPKLINMEKVNFSHCCRLEHRHLQWWLQRVCPNLLELRLQHCGLPLVMVLEAGSKLPNLRVLDLSEQEESADIVGAVTRTEAIRTSSRLQRAGYFEWNSREQSAPNRLRELSLRGRSEMTDSFLRRIARNCLSLEAVDLSGCSQLSDSGVAAFLNVYNLRKLVAAGTRFGPVSCKALVSQAGSGDELHHNLNILDLSRCSGLGSEDLRSLLGALPSLMSLDLAFTELDDRALSAFVGTSLERLNIRETKVSGEVVSQILSRNRYVKDLNIRGCRRLGLLFNLVTSSKWEHVEAGWGFTDAIFSSYFFPCGKLQSLVVGVGGSMSGQTLLRISENCPQLKRLSLCSRVIPEEELLHCIRNLTSLHTLELQNVAYTSGSLLREIGRSLRDLKTLKLERVVPLLSDNDLLEFSQSCTSLHSLSLLGCQHLTDVSLRTMADAWRGLRDLRLEDCQQILTEDALRRLLISFQALEVLHLRHIGKVLPEDFIEKAASKLPLLQKLAIDICDSKNGQFSRPYGRVETSRLKKIVYMSKCKTVKDALHTESSSSYEQKTHREDIVLEWDVEEARLKESVVEERLTFE